MPGERIVIVGAGPAGMRAALTLAEAGCRPVVLDEAQQSGGQIYRRQPSGFSRGYKALYGFEAAKARRLHDDFDALGDGIDYRPGSLVWSLEGKRLQALGEAGNQALEFDRLILATGAMDRVIPFPGWTLPGVYMLGGAQVALKQQACAIGRRVAFFGSSPLLPLVALQYAKAGAEVAAVLDTAPMAAKLSALPALLAGGATGYKGLWYLARLAALGIPYRQGVTPLEALGEAEVAGFAYKDAGGRRRELACDAIAFGYGLKSEWQLADLAGCDFVFDAQTHQWRPLQDDCGRASVPGVYLAGDGARIAGAEVAELTGELAAHALLADQGLRDREPRIRALKRRLARQAPLRRALDRAFPFPAQLARGLADDCILCRCEAITAGEFRAAATALAAQDVNRAKAFSRVGMGRCQGRVCGAAAAEILAETRGCGIEEAGRLRGQPPVKPVPIEALAGASGERAA